MRRTSTQTASPRGERALSQSARVALRVTLETLLLFPLAKTFEEISWHTATQGWAFPNSVICQQARSICKFMGNCISNTMRVCLSLCVRALWSVLLLLLLRQLVCVCVCARVCVWACVCVCVCVCGVSVSGCAFALQCGQVCIVTSCCGNLMLQMQTLLHWG